LREYIKRTVYYVEKSECAECATTVRIYLVGNFREKTTIRETDGDDPEISPDRRIEGYANVKFALRISPL